MDLSWPKGFSVNNGFRKDQYLGSYFTLHYPSLDHITDALKHLGPQALLYKIDITINLWDIDLFHMMNSKSYKYFYNYIDDFKNSRIQI